MKVPEQEQYKKLLGKIELESTASSVCACGCGVCACGGG